MKPPLTLEKLGKTVERRARLQPCRKWPARLTALAAEVRFSRIIGRTNSFASEFATDDWKDVPQGL